MYHTDLVCFDVWLLRTDLLNLLMQQLQRVLDFIVHYKCLRALCNDHNNNRKMMNPVGQSFKHKSNG